MQRSLQTREAPMPLLARFLESQLFGAGTRDVSVFAGVYAHRPDDGTAGGVTWVE